MNARMFAVHCLATKNRLLRGSTVHVRFISCLALLLMRFAVYIMVISSLELWDAGS